MQNMLNSQLPCFKPHFPQAFPSLSPFHLPSLSLSSQLPLFKLLLCCASRICFLPSPSSSTLCCFQSIPILLIHSLIRTFPLVLPNLISWLYPYSPSAFLFFPPPPPPPPYLPAVLKLYLRHSAPSILSSKWDVWPCYI